MQSAKTLRINTKQNWPEDSVLNRLVTCYPCYYITNNSADPVDISLLAFLLSTKHKTEVEEIRGLGDKALRDAKKALLPAVTIRGTFAGNREDANLVRHGGLVQVDIDFKDNQHIANYDQLKSLLCNIPNIAYCGLSVSGTGYCCIIPIKFPEKHRQHFRAIQKAFKQLGIYIDSQCINISRLRGYSYDEAAYINHYAKPIEKFETPTAKSYSTSDPTTEDGLKVLWCIEEIEKQHIDITSGYSAWWSIACSIANTFNEEGRGYFHRISQFNTNYSQDSSDKKYDEALKGYGFKIATFFYYCGWFNISPPKSITIELTSDEIMAAPVDTQTGTDFGNLILLTIWMRDGQTYDVLYDCNGELITSHEKIKPLENFFNKRFFPAKIDGRDALINIVENRN